MSILCISYLDKISNAYSKQVGVIPKIIDLLPKPVKLCRNWFEICIIDQETHYLIIWLYREFMKMQKKNCEFVKTMSFGIHEKRKCSLWICENENRPKSHIVREFVKMKNMVRENPWMDTPLGRVASKKLETRFLI